MDSLWNQTTDLPSFPSLEGDAKTDVLIIGGGITGLLCAYQLEQVGVNYILVEASRICQGITSNTTAKITAQHGLVYTKILRRYGVEKAQMYLHANLDALSDYVEMCDKNSCNLEIMDSYVYSRTNFEKLDQELQSLHTIGFDAKYTKELPLPLSTVGAVRFPKQAQFHPLRFLSQLARNLNIYERTKIVELGIQTAKTNTGTIHAEQIIIATHYPILNKHGAYFLKMYQSRSYVLALENAARVNGMYRDEDEKGLSFRNAGDRLLLGGVSHRTGKKGGDWEALFHFAKSHYPGVVAHYHWATQDCMTLDDIPYIGLYGKHTTGLYVATGYNKWGMTSSMVASKILRDMILGVDNPYAPVFDPHRSMKHFQLLINMGESTKNLLIPSKRRCPHMGCALKWNKTEHSWDCPCHGSRFDSDGSLIDNPATDDLKKC